ncbi:MAG TPA: peptidoglycan-binding protein [Egibacteraceae bacterium]|jgi:hypothetical protein|nr:peptidoglycan-binding protein [Egibacteraceae bacterium]
MSTRVIYMILVLSAALAAGAGAATLGGSGHEPVLDITFPIIGPAEVADDYGARRSGGARAHRATDVFAPMGTPVHAVAAGKVSWMPGRHPTAGYALHIRDDAGRVYAYYHLGPHTGTAAQAYARGVAEGVRVARGQVIGYVGDSGNAAGGRPHLHLEIHDDRVVDPHGTNRLNPYPSLAEARRRGDYPGAGSTSRGGARAGVLRLGDRGRAVAAWQAELNTVRVTALTVDGAFGPQTHRATRELQEAAGIAVDGVVGPQTRAALAARAPSAGVLRRGDRGPAVRAWQQQLNGVRERPIGVDAVFGPQTDRATRAFQRAAGIADDGVVGPRTRAAMSRR